MTIITATAQPDSGAIALAISATETINSISRTDANGVADVRTLPGVLPYTPTLVEARRNYITNPRPNGTTGYGTASSTGGAAWSSQVGSTFAYNRLTKDASAAATTSMTFNAAATMWAAGTPVWGTIQVRTSWASTGQWRNNSTLIAGATFALAANTWTTISLDNHAVIGAAGFRLALQFANMPAAATADVRFVGLFLSAGAWFSGAGEDFEGTKDPAYAYAWAGAVGASESFKSAPSSQLLLSDFEAASGDVAYTAESGVQGITWSIGAPWLFLPQLPAYSVRIKSLLEYSAGGTSLGSVHQLLGREDPVAILRGMSTRSGTLKLYCGTFAEAWTVVEASKRGEVLMLRQPEHEGMDMYFTATSYGIPTLATNAGKSVFAVDLAYIELGRPDGDMSSALGWTFTTLAAAWPTFAIAKKKYRTFQDMLLKKEKP